MMAKEKKIVHDNGKYEVLEIQLTSYSWKGEDRPRIVYGIRPKNQGSGDVVWMREAKNDAVRYADQLKARATHEQDDIQ